MKKLSKTEVLLLLVGVVFLAVSFPIIGWTPIIMAAPIVVFILVWRICFD